MMWAGANANHIAEHKQVAFRLQTTYELIESDSLPFKPFMKSDTNQVIML